MCGKEREKVVHLTFNMLPAWNLADVYQTEAHINEPAYTNMHILPQRKFLEGAHNDMWADR